MEYLTTQDDSQPDQQKPGNVTREHVDQCVTDLSVAQELKILETERGKRRVGTENTDKQE